MTNEDSPSRRSTDDRPTQPGSQDEPPADVPERPALAPGVELSEEMDDSAFEDQPWLILRNGDFVRVTELLYRVAEAANGERSLGEIATAVSEATGRTVSADNVAHLVRERLIPLGLVVGADGSVAKPADQSASRSPLQIGMRTAQIPGRVLEPLAQAFKVLFSPPILLAILALGLAAVGWVLLVHGVGESFRKAVYEPWLILALLPIVIASAAFHEFGHAAALAYGGGRVRGMGAGIYTAYPVFFTDVTDNYRLKRWARVRTDLGGFHFNLVFAIAIVGLYLVTGLEFLLLAVLVIVFSIVQQAIPIVRLDGYWALADMTGIPDPIAYVKPFVKSLLPVPAWRDERAPRLKTWAKAVFLLWMLIAIPILIVLSVFMLASAPRVLGTAIDSFGTHLSSLTAAASKGDVVTALAALVSIAVLVLTSVAFGWFVLKVLKGIVTRLWQWAGQSGGRRVAAGAGTLALVGGLAFLWAPPLPFNGNRAGPFHDFSPIAAGEQLTVSEAVGLAAPITPSGDGAQGEPGAGQPAGQPAATDPPRTPAPTAVPPADVDVDVPPVDVDVDVPPVEVPPVDVPPVPQPASLLPKVPDLPLP